MAELFCLLSGFSVYTAFSRLPAALLIRRTWQRFCLLYVTNLVVIVATIAVVLAADEINGRAEVLNATAINLVLQTPWPELMWSVVSFQQSFGYSAVLALYVYLTLWLPLAVVWASWRWWAPLPPAVLVWLLAGQFNIVFSNSLSGEWLALNAVSWTLVFSCGIALAAAIARGVALPRSRLLVGACLAYVLGYIVAANIAPHVEVVQAWFEARNEHFWLGGSKSLQSPMRVLHLLAVVYLFIACPKAPLIRLFYELGPRHLLCRLGRASLPVFAFGAVAAIVADEFVNGAALIWGLWSAPSIALQLALLGAVLAAKRVIADRVWPAWQRTLRRRRDASPSEPLAHTRLTAT